MNRSSSAALLLSVVVFASALLGVVSQRHRTQRLAIRSFDIYTRSALKDA